MGQIFDGSLAIRQGNNEQFLTGFLLPNQTNSSLALAATFLSNFVNNITSEFQLTGLSKDNGTSAHALTVNMLNISAYAYGQVCQLVDDITLDYMSINFNALVPNQPMDFSGQFSIYFQLPSNLLIDLNISETSLSSGLWIVSNGELIEIAKLKSSDAPVQHFHNFNQPDLLLVSLPLTLLELVDLAGFQLFALFLVTSPSVSFDLLGVAGPTAATPLGPITLSHIPANSNISLVGINRFVAPDGSSLMNVIDIDIFNANDTTLVINVAVQITNPTNVSLSGVDILFLDLIVNGSVIALVQLPNFELPLGISSPTNVQAFIPILSEAAKSVFDMFLSHYINGFSQNIQLSGNILQPDEMYLPGTSVVVLQPAIEVATNRYNIPIDCSTFYNWI